MKRFFIPLWLMACTTDDQKAAVAEPLVEVTDWCEAGLGGATGERAFSQDFARAHVGQRLFGPTGDWRGADEALVSMLGSAGALSEEVLGEYASTFSEVCHTTAASGSLSETAVSESGTVAIIRPGVGAPTISGSVTRVIIDVRDAHPDADVALAAGAALSSDLTVARRTERQMLGFPSQEDGWTHYENSLQEREVWIDGTADTDRELVFWTDAQLSPSAATVIGGLRMSGRASIVGHAVHAAVAESTWSGVGTAGLMWRSSDLATDGVRWPDIIPADISTADHEEHETAELEMGAVTGESSRTELQPYERVAEEPAADTDLATLQGALLVAYGTLDWFYPYFEVVGRDLDDALLAELDTAAALASVTRRDMKHGIGRLMHAIHDGHGYVYDWSGADWPEGYLAVQLQQIEGETVIRTSNHEGLEAGDTVIETDGVAVEDWYAEAETRYSASSDGYAFVMASDEFKEVNGSRTLTLRAPDGTEREETVGPMDWDALYSVPWGGSFRDNGWLDDLDAPNIYYVNLSDSVTPDETVVTDQWDDVVNADGIVLDMRDYPSLDIYGFAGFFNTEVFSAPWFDHPTWTGPSEFEFTREIWDMYPSEEPYTGPIALMVSPFSVSAAECFAQMLMDLPNVTVVGQQSASTNGTVTNLWLPGQFQIYFTGMRLLNLDGSQFHAIGVVPDVEVVPDHQELADGLDPELEAAISVLSL
jgi:hypothetical protein